MTIKNDYKSLVNFSKLANNGYDDKLHKLLNLAVNFIMKLKKLHIVTKQNATMFYRYPEYNTNMCTCKKMS